MSWMIQEHYICYAAADLTGGGAQVVMRVMRATANTDEACPPVTSDCVAWFLTGQGPVLVYGFGLWTSDLAVAYIICSCVLLPSVTL